MQHIAKNKKDAIFYEKEKSYDSEIKNKIQTISTISKKGISEYPNGNVNVIIPCATDF